MLLINALMFFVEIILGIISESTALIADSLDMLADASVYGVSLYVVGKATIHKIRAAYLSGVLEIMLGVMVLLDVLRRTFLGSDPESLMMMVVGMAALIANVICLNLISKHKEGEVHMQASWIFSRNDVIANIGIILGGVLVYLLDSRFPDLIIGLVISAVVVQGGFRIIGETRREKGELASCQEIVWSESRER